MSGSHVSKRLSAYAHGELSAAETERVGTHLRSCLRCRHEFEQVRLGVRLAETLRVAAAPASLWESIEEKLPPISPFTTLSAPPPINPRSFSGFVAWHRTAFAALALVLVSVIAGVAIFYRSASRPGWEVARLDGSPLVGSKRVREGGKLKVGEWLETDDSSRAKIRVADIGQVEVDPNTRVRLVETGATEHRLELARGRMSASIWAPPRLFFVDTPSAVAADLGCAYVIEVDEKGRTLLQVTSGWVALETGVRDSIVPAGASCLTEPGTGPGTPFFDDAPLPLVEALSEFDFGGGGSVALHKILSAARPRDTLTLWHLLSRVGDEERTLVFQKLQTLSPLPAGVSREAVLALEPPALRAWKEKMEDDWTRATGDSKPWRKLWR